MKKRELIIYTDSDFTGNKTSDGFILIGKSCICSISKK